MIGARYGHASGENVKSVLFSVEGYYQYKTPSTAPLPFPNDRGLNEE